MAKDVRFNKVGHHSHPTRVQAHAFTVVAGQDLLLSVLFVQVTLQLIPLLTSRFNVERYQVQWRSVPSSPMDGWNTTGCARLRFPS